jgi:hypothetical protein
MRFRKYYAIQYIQSNERIKTIIFHEEKLMFR